MTTKYKQQVSWTDEERQTVVRMREEGAAYSLIAEKLGRSVSAVSSLYTNAKRLGWDLGTPAGDKQAASLLAEGVGGALSEMFKPGVFPSEVAVMTELLQPGVFPGGQGEVKREVELPATIEEDKTEAQENLWKNRHAELERKYQRLLKTSAEAEEFVNELCNAAPKSYEPAPPVIWTRRTGTGRPQSAVFQFSDTHVGKVVTPEQTMGFGGYNFGTFLRRLKFAEESICSILRDHTTTPVDQLVIAVLGDMLDGALNHGVEAGQRDTLFAQFYGAGHAIAQCFRNLAAIVPEVRIETVVGNHTRWQNQKKMPTENRFSNLDMFLYAYIQALTSEVPNIHWNLNTQPFQYFEVQGWRFYAAHGDHWKGGDKALGIPNHAIGRQLSTTAQLCAKADKGAPHYYLTGHLHRSITIPHALGHVLINGGFPGFDNYALASNFNPVDPTQRFFLVHPKFGKTAEYELSLKFAPEGGLDPYTIPAGFPME